MESKGMKFARQMMEKMGWKEGNGLGVNQHGITEAIKPLGKFNVSGLGHKEFNDFQWWDHAFNKAAQAFEVKVTDDQGPIVEKVKSVGRITTKKSSSLTKSESLAYGSFHKTGTLSNGIEKTTTFTPVVAEEDFSVKLSDEDLFRLCGGLTAHKGARHGLTASGKLARIAQQEAELFQKLQSSEKKADDKREKRKAKHGADNTNNVSLEIKETEDTQRDTEASSVSKKSKKEKRKRKRDQENILSLENVESVLSEEKGIRPEALVVDQKCSQEGAKKKKKAKRDDDLETEEHLTNFCETVNDEIYAPFDQVTKKKKKKKSKDYTKSSCDE